tara:strand:+ start:1808 stop:2143 length:336 start_codon:yes stop_codon:yes gene_type:complete
MVLIYKMKKFLNKSFSVISLIIFLSFAPLQSYAITSSSLFDNFLVSQQKTINYEKSQPSAIDNPVVDPNFNVMRTTDMESSSTATYIVIALLLIASIVPLVTWYLSRSSTS